MITSRIVVLFLFAIPAFAGNPYSGKWKFGAHLGANFSTASIDPDIAAQGGTKSGRTDFVGGFSAQYSICDRLSVGTELKYMQYGYKFEDTQTLGVQQFSRKEDIRVNYLELPVLGNYSIVDGELAFAAFFGPFFGFRFLFGRRILVHIRNNDNNQTRPKGDHKQNAVRSHGRSRRRIQDRRPSRNPG